MYIQIHGSGISYQATITCASEIIQYRKYKTLQLLQQNISDRQNARYVTDMESSVEPYKTIPLMQYRRTLIRRDTNSQTSNLFHSNSLILKKNPYVELVNHFFGIFTKSLEEGRLDCPKYRENQVARRFFFAVFLSLSLL